MDGNINRRAFQRADHDSQLEQEVLWRDSRLIFFTMVLFASLLGIFSAVAFNFGDIQSATLLALTGLMVFIGLTVQMLVGLTWLIRLFYGVCGGALFMYLVVRAPLDNSGLLGALGLTLGFVVVLGWRMAAVFHGLLAVATVWIFVSDGYLAGAVAMHTIVEIKFIIAFAGLSLLSLGYGYANETAVTHVLEENRRVASLAFRDPMTNLANRRSTEDLLAQRWEEYKRSNYGFAIFICNIDNFKQTNNDYGRDFGDGVILRIANVMTRGLRAQDLVARWGGDEFLILLPGQNQNTALKVAERIRRRVESIELTMRGQTVPVTVSVGVAAVEQALGPEDLVSNAAAGLYQSKHMGKNRVMLG